MRCIFLCSCSPWAWEPLPSWDGTLFSAEREPKISSSPPLPSNRFQTQWRISFTSSKKCCSTCCSFSRRSSPAWPSVFCWTAWPVSERRCCGAPFHGLGWPCQPRWVKAWRCPSSLPRCGSVAVLTPLSAPWWSSSSVLGSDLATCPPTFCFGALLHNRARAVSPSCWDWRCPSV